LEEGTTRTYPQNLDAERAVLGGIIIENEAMGRVLEHIGPDDFYREAHRKIFAAIGHPVIWLKRIRFGPLCLTGLRPGEIRPLSPKEKRALRQAAGL